MGQVAQSLEVSRPGADMGLVAAPDITHRNPPLATLRVIAIIGSLAAAALIVLAFNSSLMLGLGALAFAPVVPLGLVVAVDRVLGR